MSYNVLLFLIVNLRTRGLLIFLFSVLIDLKKACTEKFEVLLYIICWAIDDTERFSFSCSECRF